MAIDYGRYLNEIRIAKDSCHKALAELKNRLENKSLPLVDGITKEMSEYASGKLFFRRLHRELELALDLLNLQERELTAVDLKSQRLYDEVSLRQRKLFEVLCATILLSRPILFQSLSRTDPASATSVPQPTPTSLYFLHYHFCHDYAYWRLRDDDLRRYYSSPNDELYQNQIKGNLKALKKMGLNECLCLWRENAKETYERALPHCTDFEKTALGFGYRQIFGSASNQIHINMSNLYEPLVDELSFVERIDNLVLLCISLILKVVQIAELIDATQTQEETECAQLRKEYTLGDFPHSYLQHAVGAADVGDVVSIFAKPKNFFGRVFKRYGGFGTKAARDAEIEAQGKQAGNKAARAAQACEGVLGKGRKSKAASLSQGRQKSREQNSAA